MKKTLYLTAGLCSLFLSGCIITFHKAEMSNRDYTEDKINMPFVAQQMEDYKDRLNFKKPVVIKMSEMSNRFLREEKRYKTTDAELRKDLMATAESKLVAIVSEMQDFELVGQETALTSNGELQIITSDDNTQQNNAPYILTYSISNVEMKDALGTGTAIAGTIAGLSNDYKTRRTGAKLSNIKWYYADVTVDIKLVSPEGKNIFAFNKNITYPKSFPTITPDLSLLKDAVAYAISAAMKNYTIKFGPPLYVDQAIGNGLFVRINAGSNFGITEGTKIRFYRNIAAKDPQGNTRFNAIPLQIGVVGKREAPITDNYAWVYLPDNDEAPDSKRVYLWSSAEIIE